MTFNPDSATIWADGPTGSPAQPPKPQIRQWSAAVEEICNAFTTNAGLIFAKKALMDAQAAIYSEPRSAWVYADSTPANNGIYVLNPTTDTWTKVGRLPYDFVIGTDLGAGTANAIQITTDIPVADGMIIAFSLFEATTGSTVTVAINGGSALTLKDASNGNASGLVAGQEVWGRYRASDSTLRLINVPRLYAQGTDAGAGTANAIKITTTSPVVDGTIVVFSLFEPTTSSPVTVSINGGAALTLKVSDGSNAAGLRAGQEIWARYRAIDNTLRLLNAPMLYTPGTDAGAGAANAIQLTTEWPVIDGSIVVFSLFEATSSSPVTVSINGGAALTIKTNRGNNASGLSAGMEIWGRYRGADSTFRLLNDQDVAALVAQTEAARDEAVEARDSLLAAVGVENYSTPTAPANVVIYVKSTGTDATTGVLHGTTEATAFLTWEAAINHAKRFYRFIGRLSTVEFRFGAGSWGAISISSTLYQGDEYYPFAVRITSIDDLNRAEFAGITCGSWLPVCVHVTKVKAGYYSVVRRNLMSVDNVSVINTGTVPYCFRFGTGAQLFVFGDIDVEEPVSFSSAFIYGTDRAFCSLENGDTPTIFPGFNLIGAGNITSPYKYRIVLGASIYCPANPYPMLTYASTYWVDAYSMSTQTQQGNDLENDAVGGPVVKRSGDTSSGYRIFADRYCEQWGTFSLSSLAVGKTVSAATVTFHVAFASATYQIEFDSNNIGLRVGKNGSATTTTCPVGAWNHEASDQSATVRWRAYGYI